MTPEGNCVIWPGFPAFDYESSGPLSHLAQGLGHFIRVRVGNSPRAGGGYAVGLFDLQPLEQLSPTQRARLTTWLIEQRGQGERTPLVAVDNLNSIVSRPPLQVHERANRLLRYFASHIETVGDGFILAGLEDHGAYAHSESLKFDELAFLTNYLHDEGWIQGNRTADGSFHGTLTVSGYARIGDLVQNVDTTQVFVAMWFDESMNAAYRDGIEPAIKATGYTAFRIDRKDHINKIDDEIIAELRRSRFVVADFTHGEDGARGGVYYEAGFAHALNLPVIFTCREDAVANLHFDTNHYNHIVWKSPDELREQLRNRILAVIGSGPGPDGAGH